jgi:hypothetical protein
MATTLLARKSGPQDNTIATNDDHQSQLISDPAVQEFSSTQSSDFSSPTSGGFGVSSNNFSSPQSSTSLGNNFGGSNPPINATQAPQMNLTQAGSNAAQGADVLVQHDKESQDWINKKWRPAMGWMYMLTCFADFVIFPILWSLLQAMSKGTVTSQWQPLTLQGAGLYHIAMGAVLGIAAYGRTKEKVEGKA